MDYPKRVEQWFYGNQPGHEMVISQSEKPAWTTEPPTEPGWYWAVDGVHRGTPWVVYIDNTGYVIVPGFIHKSAAPVFTHWLGPLTVPEPPA